MTTINVKNLQFIFDASWRVDKYDDWVFYRNEFIKMQNGIKAIDLIAIDDSTIWLIEVKDYSRATTKPSNLVEVVVQKAFNTLAAMLPAQVHASDPNERQFAQQVNKATQLRVVLHIEQPQTYSTLFPSAIDRADVQQKLRQKIKPIDPNPRVVESGQMERLGWQVLKIN